MEEIDELSKKTSEELRLEDLRVGIFVLFMTWRFDFTTLLLYL